MIQQHSSILSVILLLALASFTVQQEAKGTATGALNLKNTGSKCFRDGECASECCYQSTCTRTMKECAEERIDLLQQIIAQMQRESQTNATHNGTGFPNNPKSETSDHSNYSQDLTISDQLPRLYETIKTAQETIPTQTANSASIDDTKVTKASDKEVIDIFDSNKDSTSQQSEGGILLLASETSQEFLSEDPDSFSLLEERQDQQMQKQALTSSVWYNQESYGLSMILKLVSLALLMLAIVGLSRKLCMYKCCPEMKFKLQTERDWEANEGVKDDQFVRI